MVEDKLCHCGSENIYSQCCGPLHDGINLATTAEQLMRSRYSAYVLQNAAYLLQTWHATTSPSTLELDKDGVKWLGLKIVSTQAGQQQDSDGTVEFIARYKLNGKAYHMQEKSRFRKEQSQWFYVDGEIKP